MAIVLYIVASYVIGLGLLLLVDSYLKGRYKASLFSVEGVEDRQLSIVFWPIYVTYRTLSTVIRFTYHQISLHFKMLMIYVETKGKQANDPDYQAEKWLLKK